MKMDDNSILLESGTNELEVLEFYLAGTSFGINVSKVRELIRYEKVQKIPQAQPYVEGIFCPRKEIFTVVDLAGYLGLPASETPEKDLLIITYFNQISTAFHVHGVSSIHRLSWENVEKLDSSLYGGVEGVITGFAKVEDRMIPILDFEKIMVDINPGSSVEANSMKFEKTRRTEENSRPILVAEDSMVLRKMILEALFKAGYVNVKVKDNGLEAWNYLESLKETGDPVTDHVACIITDIEMPKMDGHHLTKRVKDDPLLSQIPVIIFSSLISPEMMIKGKELGADAQLSKPDIGQLVAVIDGLMNNQ